MRTRRRKAAFEQTEEKCGACNCAQSFTLIAAAARANRNIHARVFPSNATGLRKIPRLKDGLNICGEISRFCRRQCRSGSRTDLFLSRCNCFVHTYKLSLQLLKHVRIPELES